MKAKELMDAIGGISNRHIEKYAEVKPAAIKGKAEEKKTFADKKRVRTVILAAAAVLAAALAMIPIIHKLRGNDNPGEITAYNSPNPDLTESPEQTKVPVQRTADTDPTERPTVTEGADATSGPIADPTEQPFCTIDYKSEHEQYVVFANTVLNGGSYGTEETFSYDGGGVYFGVEDGKLTAYAEAIIHDDPGDVRYELLSPIAYYPYELGARASRSVSDYIRRNINPDFAGDDELQLFGFIGGNYIIFTNEPLHGCQACALFFTEDGENWTELDAMSERHMPSTGGCVLSESEAYMCYFDVAQMMNDEYTPRRLAVYHTTDGGRTWEDIGLCIPEEYEGLIAPPAAALSPVFIGGHGIIPVTYSTYNAATEGFDSHTSWFETFDGGESWEFHLN